MRVLKKPWLIVLVGLVVGTFVFALNNPFTEASALSEEEMKTQLSAMYDGDIEELTLRGKAYEAKVLKNEAVYTVQADAESGKVLSLEQTKEAPPETTPPEQTDEKPEETEAPPTEETEPPEDQEPTKEDPSPPEEDPPEEEVEEEDTIEEVDESPEEPEEEPEPTTLISEEEAANIGLAALPEGMAGEVDDIEFKDSTEGGYYLVEIEIDTEDGADEVVYQIHAISGEVLTAKWDD